MNTFTIGLFLVIADNYYPDWRYLVDIFVIWGWEIAHKIGNLDLHNVLM